MLNERYDNQRVIVQKHIKAIFEHPNLIKENHIELRQLLDNILKHLRALKVLQRSTDKWDDLLIHVITCKLPPVTNKEWETSLEGSDVPSFKELIDFLSQRCRALEAIDRRSQTAVTATHTDRNIKMSKKATSAHVVTDKAACSFCKGNHPVFRCDKFLSLAVDKRIQEIRERKICLNCLRSTEHRAKNCNSGACKTCHKKHNNFFILRQISN
ncbi:uncharacterized protein [Anoplolepis gracilipes]|uniref:uncharacterized protein n=1 Tax=Anoplolepis gracilipes TaxID=354296 RepID=UPI003BA074CE